MLTFASGLASRTPRGCTRLRTGAGFRARRVVYSRSAASEGTRSTPKQNKGILRGLKELVQPFEDAKANNRFLALALGGLLCSIATLIHDSYLPVFMREELGMTNTRIGSVQALSQLLCQIAKSFSGVMGDLLGSQVKILVFGTGLTALCKPMFAVSSVVFSAFGAGACLWCIMVGKMMDRVSKGFREAPTKALISQTARGVGESADAAFSVRQSLATVGSLVGSAIASAVFIASGQSYVVTFAAAAVPPTLALAWLLFTFRGQLSAPASPAPLPASAAGRGAQKPQEKSEAKVGLLRKGRLLVRAFTPAYWQALIVVAVLYFGRFDFAWVTLRAQACAVPKAMLPALASATMLATTLTALTTGRVAKGKGVRVRNTLLFAGFAFLFAANALFAAPASANIGGMFAACVLVGVHMGMTHGLTLSMLSSYMPHDDLPGLGKVAGTAWSFTDVILGCILAASNQLAGQLTDLTVAKSLGNVGCFGGGAAAALGAIVMLAVFVRFGDLAKP